MGTSLIEMVARHEGFRASVYCDKCGEQLRLSGLQTAGWKCSDPCSGGNLTIGYGQRVDGAGITHNQSMLLLNDRLCDLKVELSRASWWASLDPFRQFAIVDMAYTLGVAGVLEFKHMIAALERQDWRAAHLEVLASEWARQASARAGEVADILFTGVMPGS